MTLCAISGISFLVMRMQNKLLFRLGALIVLALVLGLGLVAGLRQFRHPGPTQEPAPPISARNPPAQTSDSSAQTQVQQYKTEYTTPDAIETVLAYNPGWNFTVVSIDKQTLKAQRIEVGRRHSPSQASSDMELAEAHNMLLMKSYQDRVIRQLNSMTPVLPVRYNAPLDETIWPAIPPVRFTPTFREQRFDDSGAK